MLWIKQSGLLSAWRRGAVVGTLGLLLGLAGCSSSGEAGTLQGSKFVSGADQPSTTSAASAQPMPTNSDDASSSAPLESSDAEVTSSDDAYAVPTETDPGAAAPTRPTMPEPALSDAQIREEYGDGATTPADSVAGTLCNLSREHFNQLSGRILNDGAIDDQMLRMAALSLSDNLGVWEGMAWQYPDISKELDKAREIYVHWEYAVGLVDAGDLATASQEIEAAERLISSLPDEEIVEVGC